MSAPGSRTTPPSPSSRQACLRGVDQADVYLLLLGGRYGEPIELGRFAAFLLSPAASYVSGLAAQVDGAMVTALP